MRRILLTGAGGPAGVNFVEALRLASEPFFVIGTDINRWHLELSNADKTFIVPRCSDPSYIDVLNHIIDVDKIDFLHPQPDVEVRVISENRERLHAKTFLPSKDTVRVCQDKYLSAVRWDKNGVPVARAIDLRDEHLVDDLARAFDELGNTIWIRAKTGAGGRGSTPADSLEVAEHWIRYWRGRGKPWDFFAQEYLPGDNIAFQSVFLDGEPVTSQARQRLEYIYPYLAPSGITGTPAVAKTIHSDKVNSTAIQAVQAIDEKASGIFCVDLRDNKDGEPHPTEINCGRFFTTSAFFAHLGAKLSLLYANMPFVYVKLGFGESLGESPPRTNAVPAGYYWIRHIDCGHHLVKEGEWSSELVKRGQGH
ncbi:MAG: hypothetical protein ACFFCO_08890 [Promethearchaeota archaeon]